MAIRGATDNLGEVLKCCAGREDVHGGGSRGTKPRHETSKNSPNMKRLKLKTSPSSYGLASLQHPAAPLGLHGDVQTYMVIDIPDNVTAGMVLHQFNQTITVRGEIYHYGDLGVGKIVFGDESKTEPSAEWTEEQARECGDYRSNEEVAEAYPRKTFWMGGRA